MENYSIKIKGAKVHNLKNIDVKIPRDKFTVITGISGSGKSSLAFDVLYAEGQRRYIESLSPYARQFLGMADKPNVESIEGISPAISISPKKAIRNPRSTVGTVSEIYDYLRLLFSKVGKPHCPLCKKLLGKQEISQIANRILKLKNNSEITILSPVVRFKKGGHKDVLKEIKRKGFVRVRIDGVIYKIEEALDKELESGKNHNIEAVIDQATFDSLDRQRLLDSLKIGLRIGKGMVIVNHQSSGSKTEDLDFNENYTCENCGISLPELEPRLFSFNNPLGACPECTGLGEKPEVDPDLLIPNKNLTIEEGAIRPYVRTFHRYGEQNAFWQEIKKLAERRNFSLSEPVKDISEENVNFILYGDGKFEGIIPNLEKKYRESSSDWIRNEIEQYMVVKKCFKCSGKRLKPEVLAVKIADRSIDEMAEMNIEKLKVFLKILLNNKNIFSKNEINIVKPIIKETLNRLQLLIEVGLDYLTLDRKASTLSGGEEQRIRLAIQIGAKLHGVLYVLDEPSVGLHARDQKKLIRIIKKLRDLGNTVLVVEHDPQTIKSADWIIDIGPKAGKEGGKIIFEGKPEKLMKAKTLTGEYLSGRKKIEIPDTVKEQFSKFLTIKGAQENNLKNLDVRIPLGNFVCVTGVSGSGKSSLVDDILAKALLKKIYRAKEEPGKFKEIIGSELLNKIVLVDQSPIGRTPRSNPATYTGAFSFIRDIFSKTKEAKERGYSSGKFSFNVKGGRCEFCEGQGQVKVEMYFLPDVYVECNECKGKRYNSEALEVEYKGKNIAEVLDMSVSEALKFFKDTPGLYQKLKTLDQVGLSYMKLGQPAPSLSGGEAQRVKLSTELSRKDTGSTLYVLDEPTSGLHFYDINKLILVLRNLVNKGNTVLTVEHNIDFIKCADWIVDLGPEGGDKGGEIVAEGTPKEIAKNKKSHTGKYL